MQYLIMLFESNFAGSGNGVFNHVWYEEDEQYQICILHQGAERIEGVQGEDKIDMNYARSGGMPPANFEILHALTITLI